MYIHKGSCHCNAIRIELQTPRQPHEQIVGACQCLFCRKHNARTFSDPKSNTTLTVADPEYLQRYTFGLKTAEVVLCSRCGVYVAMVLIEGERAWSVINIDALDEWTMFTQAAEPRDYSAEDPHGRIERRKSRWVPTKLIGWPRP